MSLRLRIWSIPAIAVLVFVLSLAFTLSSSKETARIISNLGTADYPRLGIALRLDQDLKSVDDSLQTAVAEGDKTKLVEVERLAAAFQKGTDDLAAVANEAQEAQALRSDFEAYHITARQVSELMLDGKTGNSQGAIEKMQRAHNEVVTAVSAAVAKARKDVTASVEASNAGVHRIVTTTLAGALIVVSALIVSSFFIAGSIMHPLQRAKGIAESIAAGKLDNAIDTANHDEIGEVLSALKAMQSVLRDAAEKAADYEGQITAIGRSQTVIEFDLDGTILTANDQYLQLTGYSLEEVRGHHNNEFVVPDTYTGPEMTAMWEKLGRGQSHTRTSRRIVRGGGLLWLQANYNPILAPEGKPYKIVAFGTDVTDQVMMKDALAEAKEAAEAANRAKSSFLATMSHEIRTPMNGVLGMLELLTLTRLDAEQRSTLDVVRDSGRTLQRIIDDILDFSKIDAGKLDLRPVPSSISSAVDTARDIFSGNASSKGLILTSRVDPTISPALLFDPIRLRQILCNFVSNAIKFTAKGQIEISAQLLGQHEGKDRIRISVTDTGVGISADDQGRLFQPFVQGAAETKMRPAGTGLGLTICRRLAQLMDGSVGMVSALGVGTTMSVELSLRVCDPNEMQPDEIADPGEFLKTTAMRRRAPSPARAEIEGTLALVVDDHPTNRTLLLRQINLLGYAAESAVNGSEAFEKWKSGRFGVVITDCNMPAMSGYELAQSIREFESARGTKRTPVIACTANAFDGEAEACFAAGMDAYLSKPVRLNDLGAKLDQWLPLASAVTPLDPAALAELTGGHQTEEREILVGFRRAHDEDAAAIIRAIDQRDIPQVTIASHRIKGACRVIGANALADASEQIERACRAADWTLIHASVPAFRHELERLNLFLEEVLCAPLN
jgi:PAS domain S-box-containing protein